MMKRSYFLFAISLCVIFTGCKKETVEPDPTPAAPKTIQVEWEEVHSLVSKGQLGYYVLDDKRAWIGLSTSSTAKILKTTDGGVSWQTLDVGVPSDLVLAVHFKDDNNGFVSMHQKGTYSTTDGGSTWKLITTRQGGLHMNGNQLSIFSAGGRVYHWLAASDTVKLINDSLKLIAFPKNIWTHGNTVTYAFQTGVIRSDDGGINWYRIETPFASLSFMTAKDASNWYVIPANKGVFSSSNGGTKWNELNATDGFSYNPAIYKDSIFVSKGANVQWTLDWKTFKDVSDIHFNGHLFVLGSRLIGYNTKGVYIRKWVLK